MAQLVASMSGVVLGGVVQVMGSNLARGKIFTASIGSVDSLYSSVYIRAHLHAHTYTHTHCKMNHPRLFVPNQMGEFISTFVYENLRSLFEIRTYLLRYFLFKITLAHGCT